MSAAFPLAMFTLAGDYVYNGEQAVVGGALWLFRFYQNGAFQRRSMATGICARCFSIRHWARPRRSISQASRSMAIPKCCRR